MSRWTLIDTETDGLRPPVHIIEVAAQKFEDLRPVGVPLRIFINHGIQIPWAATLVHGYTTEFITQHGIAPRHAYALLGDFIQDTPVSAHYLMFDWDRVLVPELSRLAETPIGTRGFCTWLLARRALPEHPTHRLDFLREKHRLECSRPHTALGDVESVKDLLTRIIFPRLEKIGFGTIDGVHRFAALRPALRCKCLIQGLDYGEELRKIRQALAEARRLEQLIFEVESGQHSIPALILENDLIEEEPTITFRGHTFLLTGKMSCGSRPEAEKEIQLRGGRLLKSKGITADLDYLVLGEDRDRGWTSLLHGGKLTNAFVARLREPRLKYRIVREQDFVAALQAQGAPAAREFEARTDSLVPVPQQAGHQAGHGTALHPEP